MKLPKLLDWINEDVVGLVVTGIVLVSVLSKLAIVWLAAHISAKLSTWVSEHVTLDHFCGLFAKRSMRHER